MTDQQQAPIVDTDTVRRFLEIVSGHAAKVINGTNPTGVLQLCRISPSNGKDVVPSRFNLDDLEAMVKVAIDDATAGHNVYIETRTVNASLSGKKRGELNDTTLVFGLVVDSDADKGKAGNVSVRPSLAVETSPGNYHLWYLFTQAIPAQRAKELGTIIRKASGADQDTGVVTQCYRVAGTPNFPSSAKRARGRTAAPTRIYEYTARLWDPDELQAAFQESGPPVASQGVPADTGLEPEPDLGDQTSDIDADEASLPEELLEVIRFGAGPDDDRSVQFHSVVGQLQKRRWTIEAITELFEKYPNGIAQKYAGRVREEVERSYGKLAVVASVSPGSNAGPSTGPSAAAPGVGPGPGASAAPGPVAGVGSAPRPQHILQTIHVVASQLPRMLAETERALLAAGLPIFSRAGTLVHPVTETTRAAGGGKTIAARLRTFCADSLIEWVSDAALFRRFNARQQKWVDADPPRQVVSSLLTRQGRWTIPPVSGVITTPTLRSDGSLLSVAGYDRRSELYLLPGVQLPPMPAQPTYEQAQDALKLLVELFSEFSFVADIDRTVALAGLLTALLRGSLSTAPIYVVRAHAPGTGKSYLVDLIATIATGRLCPVITAGKTEEETEKRLGSVILSGTPIVSIDNVVTDLEGQLLCQITERPLVKIRILGRSDMPECECHTTVFATGNNITLKGDMVRRGVECNLDALTERPELREFQRDPVRQVMADRGKYVAAALLITRSYLAAGSPSVCGPIGSYADWSAMVRSPLVWLGQPDPVASMEAAREDDPELADIREFFELWHSSKLLLDEPYTTGGIIEIACEPPAPNDFNRPLFKEFLLRIAADRDGVVSARRLGWWLRGISGRVVDGHRLEMGRQNKASACWTLVQT
jgi:RepB DNA-primase N-terminal domain